MIARYKTRCSLCSSDINPGDRIVKWVGKSVHPDCREREQSSAPKVTLSPGKIRRDPQPLRPHVGHTRGIRRVV